MPIPSAEIWGSGDLNQGMPDPATDPQGYMAWAQQQVANMGGAYAPWGGQPSEYTTPSVQYTNSGDPYVVGTVGPEFDALRDNTLRDSFDWRNAFRDIAPVVGGLFGGAALAGLAGVGGTTGPANALGFGSGGAAAGGATTFPLAGAPSAGSLAAVPGTPTAGAGLTGVGGAAAIPTELIGGAAIPTGGAGFAAAPLTGGTGAIGGGLLPGVAAGSGGLGGMVAGGAGGLVSGGSALSALEKWAPYITGGVNALLGANAADKASDAESAALDKAIAEQQRQFDLSRADNARWLAAGQQALADIQNPDAFTASPQYGFVRNEGIRGIGNSFAARGGSMSGNAMRALSDYNTGLASGEYQNWIGNKLNLAGLGSDVARNQAVVGANKASNVGNYLAGQGEARASGVLGRNYAIGNALNDTIYNALYRRRP